MNENELFKKKLEDFRDGINLIEDIISKDNNDINCKIAQGKLKILKEKFKEEISLYTLKKNNERVTNFIKSYYIPTIQKASAAINVRCNTKPNSDWISELYSAKIEIEFTLNQLVSI